LGFENFSATVSGSVIKCKVRLRLRLTVHKYNIINSKIVRKEVKVKYLALIGEEITVSVVKATGDEYLMIFKVRER